MTFRLQASAIGFLLLACAACARQQPAAMTSQALSACTAQMAKGAPNMPEATLRATCLSNYASSHMTKQAYVANGEADAMAAGFLLGTLNGAAPRPVTPQTETTCLPIRGGGYSCTTD